MKKQLAMESIESIGNVIYKAINGDEVSIATAKVLDIPTNKDQLIGFMHGLKYAREIVQAVDVSNSLVMIP